MTGMKKYLTIWPQPLFALGQSAPVCRGFPDRLSRMIFVQLFPDIEKAEIGPLPRIVANTNGSSGNEKVGADRRTDFCQISDLVCRRSKNGCHFVVCLNRLHNNRRQLPPAAIAAQGLANTLKDQRLIAGLQCHNAPRLGNCISINRRFSRIPEGLRDWPAAGRWPHLGHRFLPFLSPALNAPVDNHQNRQ